MVERRHNFTIRDELDLETTGHIKGVASISGTTINATTIGTTDATLTGDLTRNSVKYISGSTIVSGYTSITDNMEIIDEGIAFLDGKSGSMTPKLSKSPTIGNTLSVIYIDSGAANTAIVSGSFKLGAGLDTQHFATFSYPGDSVTLTGDGTFWYSIHPASGNIPGPGFST